MRRLLAPLLVFFGFIGFWYFSATYIVSDAVQKTSLAYPHEVLTVFTGSFSEQPAELLSAFWITLIVALLGLVISILLGVTAAIAMHTAQWVEDSLYPYAVFLQTVPILALVPLISLVFGYGFGSRVLVCVIISLFPIITNTLFGLKTVDKGLLDLYQIHNASRWQRFRRLQLPSALPAMLTGFQISAGLSVIGAIIGGFFFQRGQHDLGNRILLYSNRLRPAELIAAIVLSAVMGLMLFLFFGVIRKKVTEKRNISF